MRGATDHVSLSISESHRLYAIFSELDYPRRNRRLANRLGDLRRELFDEDTDVNLMVSDFNLEERVVKISEDSKSCSLSMLCTLLGLKACSDWLDRRFATQALGPAVRDML